MNEVHTPGTEITDAEVIEQLQADLASVRRELEETCKERDAAFEKAAVAEKDAAEFAVQVVDMTGKRLADRQHFQEAARNYKRKRLLTLKVPVLAIVAFAAIALGSMAATEKALMVPALGNLLTVAAMVGCAFFCGLVYERVRK